MSEMIERAARAAFEHEHVSDGCSWQQLGPLEDYGGAWRSLARAALSAALDENDEALISRVGMEIADDLNGLFDEAQVKRIIATLKAAALSANQPT